MSGFEQSERKYDWLGFGVYFWEDSPDRAWTWVRDKFPDCECCVIDANISLKRCLNLAGPKGIARLKPFYDWFVEEIGDESAARLASTVKGNRELDCAVINYACIRSREHDPIHVVRAAFQEGEPIYPGRKSGVPSSRIFDLNHVQLAVRDQCAIIDFRVEDEPEE